MEGRPLSESELVANAKNGDLSAYEQLVREHQAMALRVAYLVVRNHAGAEDVTQDAFVKAHRNLDRFRDGSPFRPWLLRIVRNEALNRARGEGRKEQMSLRLASDPSSGGAAPSPETAVISSEEKRNVLEALERLPARFRDVVAARFLLDLSEGETAAMLGVPKGTVKSRTARGLERLREILGEADV